jgi:hypothetical protein
MKKFNHETKTLAFASVNGPERWARFLNGRAYLLRLLWQRAAWTGKASTLRKHIVT